jgi:hypothetical protein
LNWWQAEKANKSSRSTSQSANPAISPKAGKSKGNRYKGKHKSTSSNKSNREETKPKVEESSDEEFSFPVVEDSTPAVEEKASIANSSNFTPHSRHILIDSGATSHFTGRRDVLEDEREIAPIKRFLQLLVKELLNLQVKCDLIVV